MGPPERLGERHRLPQQPDDRSRKPQCENDNIQANHLPPKSKVPPGAQDLPSADHPAILASRPAPPAPKDNPDAKTSPSAQSSRFCGNPAETLRKGAVRGPALARSGKTHSLPRARRRQTRQLARRPPLSRTRLAGTCARTASRSRDLRPEPIRPPPLPARTPAPRPAAKTLPRAPEAHPCGRGGDLRAVLNARLAKNDGLTTLDSQKRTPSAHIHTLSLA